MVISKIINFGGKQEGWYCFCVRSMDQKEGHTGPEHLVMFYFPKLKEKTKLSIFDPNLPIHVRLHSECLLGDVFYTSRCDCRQQLVSAIEKIESVGQGVIFYLRQEGRGVGLFDKIESLTIHHHNTFRRNELAGLEADARSYGTAAKLLRLMGIEKVVLLSGNIQKARALEESGITVVLDNSLSLSDLTDEAKLEIYSKIDRGYKYTFSSNDF